MCAQMCPGRYTFTAHIQPDYKSTTACFVWLVGCFNVLCLHLRCQILENTRKCTVEVLIVREVTTWRQRTVKPTLNFQVNLCYRTTSYKSIVFLQMCFVSRVNSFSNSYSLVLGEVVRITIQHTCDCNLIIVGPSSS